MSRRTLVDIGAGIEQFPHPVKMAIAAASLNAEVLRAAARRAGGDRFQADGHGGRERDPVAGQPHFSGERIDPAASRSFTSSRLPLQTRDEERGSIPAVVELAPWRGARLSGRDRH